MSYQFWNSNIDKSLAADIYRSGLPKTVHYRKHDVGAPPSWLRNQSLLRDPRWPQPLGLLFAVALGLGAWALLAYSIIWVTR